GIPLCLGDAEAVERERHARQRRDAVPEHGERANQLSRAGLQRLAVLRSDDVERVQHPLDDRVGGADDEEREAEGEQRGADGAHRGRQHYSRLILRKFASSRVRSGLMLTRTTDAPDGTRPRATSCWPMSVPAESTFSPMSVHTGITPQ